MSASPTLPDPLGRTAILTHQDLDGFVTAALVKAFLGTQGVLNVDVDFVDFPMEKAYGTLWDTHLHKGERADGTPMDLGGAPQAVVVSDFPITWVPDGVTFIHIDHHRAIIEPGMVPAEMMPRYQELVRRGQNHPLARQLSIRNSAAPSAAHLVFERLTDMGHRVLPELVEATRFATQVDTLRFPDVPSAMNLRRAPMLYDFAVRNLPPAELRAACEALASGQPLLDALIYPNREFLEREILRTEREIALARRQRRRVGRSGSALVVSYDRPDKAIKLCHYEDPSVRYGITIEIRPEFRSGGREWKLRVNMAKAPTNWGRPLAVGEPDLDMRQALMDVLHMGGGHSFSAGATHTANSYGQAIAWAEDTITRLGQWLAAAETPMAAGHQGNTESADPEPLLGNGRTAPQAPIAEYPRRGGSPHREIARRELGPTR